MSTMKKRWVQFVVLGVVALAIYSIGLYHGNTGEALSVVASAEAVESGGPELPLRTIQKDPVGTISDPYMYYPGTEALGADEIRVVACGTGMPAARRGQGAACFLVELGNGDKFLFERIAAPVIMPVA